jgi:hypothetical protein
VIEDNQAVNMEDIAHQTFDTEACYPGTLGGQPAASPDQGIVGQGFQLGEHLLGLEAFLVAAEGFLVFRLLFWRDF